MFVVATRRERENNKWKKTSNQPLSVCLVQLFLWSGEGEKTLADNSHKQKQLLKSWTKLGKNPSKSEMF